MPKTKITGILEEKDENTMKVKFREKGWFSLAERAKEYLRFQKLGKYTEAELDKGNKIDFITQKFKSDPDSASSQQMPHKSQPSSQIENAKTRGGYSHDAAAIVASRPQEFKNADAAIDAVIILADKLVEASIKRQASR